MSPTGCKFACAAGIPSPSVLWSDGMRGKSMQVARKIGVGIAAAVVAGIVAGALARLMMRLVTVVAGEEASFTVGGTLGILLVLSVFALPGSLLAALVRRRGRSILLVVSALGLCLPATSIALTDLEGVGGLSAMQWVGVGVWTAGVYAAIATMPVVALRVIAAMSRPHPAAATALTTEPLGA